MNHQPISGSIIFVRKDVNVENRVPSTRDTLRLAACANNAMGHSGARGRVGNGAIGR
jgi:hypothetical protein